MEQRGKGKKGIIIVTVIAVIGVAGAVFSAIGWIRELGKKNDTVSQQEYNQLEDKYAELESSYNALVSEFEELKKDSEDETQESDTQVTEGETPFSQIHEVLYDGSGYDKYLGDKTFQVGGKNYNSGFQLVAGQNYTGNVMFNLEQKYKKMRFDVGRIDGSGQNSATLFITSKEGMEEQFELLADDISQSIEIEVDNVSELKMELSGEVDSVYYGFFNIVFE